MQFPTIPVIALATLTLMMMGTKGSQFPMEGCQVTCPLSCPGKPKTKVAFSAMSTNGLRSGNAPVDITFQKTLTNLGQGFDDASTFRAPVDGAYFITFAVHTGDQVARVYLFTNAGYVNEAYGTPGGQTSTNQAILRLQKGDRVWLQLQPGGYIISAPNHIHISFNGFLLYED